MDITNITKGLFGLDLQQLKEIGTYLGFEIEDDPGTAGMGAKNRPPRPDMPARHSRQHAEPEADLELCESC